MPAHTPPPGTHITYSRQYRRCGRPGCPTCRAPHPGHGPYWYAYWREGGRQCSRYLGKAPPPEAGSARDEAAAAPCVDRRAVDAAPPTMPPALRVRTLGGLAVWRGAVDLHVESWRLRPAVALFACLLGAPGQRLRREDLAERLWPEGEPGAGQGNLRRTAYHLRRLLGQQGTDGGYLTQEGAFLRLDPAPGRAPPDDWLDADAFERAAAAALAGQDADACRAALALYGGAYLPEEPYAEWAAATREKLAGRHLALLLHLAALCRAAGDAVEAERTLREALAADPCHEGAAQALMGLLAAEGRRGEALRVYQQVAGALDRELGLGPQAALEGLRARLLVEAATPVAADYAPRLRLPGRPTNLPAPASSFVGRAWELGEVQRLLAETRLLTLTGPGGCGKSRLAAEAAGALLGAYPDGMWLVELAALADPALVVRAVAAALGVVEPADRPLLEALADFLAPRRLLLLLDNCEHLLDVCAALAAQVLASCPEVRILATSRQALGLAGEVAWLVPALAYPGAEVSAPSPAELASYEAVQLFVARARAHRPAFALTAENAGAVARLCRQLDGLPLALELAAARLGALSAGEVAARLGDRLALLGGGSRTALPRHRTLMAALDWSWDLLHEAERTLLRRCAVFAGGWTLEAAEAVCGDGATLTAATGRRGDGAGGGDLEEPALTDASSRPQSPSVRSDRSGRPEPTETVAPEEVLDLLAALVARSLVQVAEWEGQSRYGLLETVRQYATERLTAAGEAAALRDRHLAYFLALAEEAEPRLTGPGQGTWLERLEAEHDNLRAALAWAQEGEGADAGLRLAGALWRFWYVRGHLGEGGAWLERLLDLQRRAGGVASAAVVKALRGAGALAYRRGDHARAVELGQEALGLCERLGDRRGRIGPLNLLALVAREQGRLGQAIRLQEDLLALCREVGTRRDLAMSLHNMALLRRDRGEYRQAVGLYEESLAIKRELGDSSAICTTLHNLADVAAILGEFARAAALAHESLDLARQVGHTAAMAYASTCLGYIATEHGEYLRAEEYYTQALTLRREAEDRPGVVGQLINLGAVARRRGERERAEGLYREGLALCGRGGGEYTSAPLCLEGMAWVLCGAGRAERAARLLGAAAAAQDGLEGVMLPSERAEFERTFGAVRSMLGSGPFAAAWAAGRALALEQAVAEALAGGPGG